MPLVPLGRSFRAQSLPYRFGADSFRGMGGAPRWSISSPVRRAEGGDSLLLECGIAGSTLPGQRISGDHYLVAPFPGGALVAVVDGVGHGNEASIAARTAVNTLKGL